MQNFFTLTPERMLDAVERALGGGARATGRCLALNSMENRVYEIELESGSSVVTKFYRPGRWSREAILDEHRFLGELVAHEIPVVAPLALAGGATLAESEDGILFAVFPKMRGQIVQELDEARLMQVGRLLARLHNVGASAQAPHRIRLTPETYGTSSLEFLASSGSVEARLWPRYHAAAIAILDTIRAGFAGVVTHRIHGDCHLGNVLWQPAGPFFLDFDDMVTGPAVQDVWLIVRGRDEHALRARDTLLAGYEQMRAFDRGTLKLIEGLRALRMIHYAAWIARRWEDPSFKNAFPDFGTYRYWEEQCADLEEQLDYVVAG